MAAAAIAVALLAGCGGASPAQPAGSTRVTLTEFKMDPGTVSVGSGKVVFYVVNAGTTSHDMIIRNSANLRVAGTGLLSAGDSVIFTIDNLPAGTYTYFCDVTGHDASGMHGTVTVT